MLRWILDRKGGWIVLTLVALVIFIGVNVAAGRVVGVRADLTEDKLYSLSAGTHNILDKLQKPVELTLYYSDELGKAAPVYGNYEVRVKDLLRVIESTSNGKVRLTVENPKPFSEIEDKAVALGLQGVPVDDSGAKVYFGLAAKSGDKEIVIPFFQIEREKFLEYDVASLIFNLGTKGKPVVAVYTSRQMFGDLQMQMAGMPTHPYAVIQQLANHAEVKQIYDFADIWKDKPDVLMIVHPGNLSDKDYYNIDQYLLRGGKALIFVDPYNETAATHRGQFPERVTSDMDRLLKHWGIEMVKDRVVGDRRYARMVNAGDDKRVIPAPFLTWMAIRNDSFSQTDAVTSQITLLNMESAGILEAKKESTLKFEPLIESSPESQEIDVSLLKGQKPQILSMLQNFKPSGHPLVVAARVSGRTTTMFPDGPPKEEPKKDEEKKDSEKKDSGKSSDAGKDAQPPAAATPASAKAEGAKAGSETPAAAVNGKTDEKATEKASEKAGEKGMVKADVAERPAAPALAQADTKPADAAPAAREKAGEKTEAAPAAKPADAAKPAEAKPADAAAGDKKAGDKKADEKKDEAKKEPEEPKAPPFVAESTAPMNVIVVSDADMLEDRFWVQNRDFFGHQVQVPFANNSDFVVNAVENLAGGDDLIGLRSRGTAQRPFTKIAELKLEADEKFRAEEQRLRKKLDDAEKKLAELDKKKAEGAGEETLDSAVKATAAKFTEEVLTTRKALRKVQLALREDIESLERSLRFINIALIPILVGVLAVVLGLVRIRRRKHHGDTPAA
jgi:gliding motility-associatede transport system auxiliary component